MYEEYEHEFYQHALKIILVIVFVYLENSPIVQYKFSWKISVHENTYISMVLYI